MQKPHHIETSRGWKAALPWLFAGSVGAACSWTVSSVSGAWSAEVTKAWLGTTVLSLFWKLIILDPMKVLCCGALLEPLAACLSCDLAMNVDAFLESFEDVMVRCLSTNN